MIFGNKSELMLKYQKAKAKLVEYDTPIDQYPHFTHDSNELSYPTTYILSRYAECIVANHSQELSELSPFLAATAQYYDAAVNSKDREVYDFDFLLSGASAYFFSNDFGSSKVLTQKAYVAFKSEINSPQQLLLNILGYLLLGKRLPYVRNNDIYTNIKNAFADCFDKGCDDEPLRKNLNKLRNIVYYEKDPDDVFYIDILIAIVCITLDNSAWKLLPEYTDVSKESWDSYLSKRTSIKMLWPAQRLIAEKGILSGENSIVQLPTGVGKTKSIELIIRSAFLSGRASTAIIVAPLRALCNEITSDMSRAFGQEANINQFSDVLQTDFIFSFEEDEKQILICTPEKLNYVLHHQTDFLDSIDLFVFDEGHMFDDGGRGATYELLVTHIRENIGEDQQFVLLSAVLPNAVQIQEWLFTDGGVLASNPQITSTPKSIGFSSSKSDIHFYSNSSRKEDFYIPRVLQIIPLDKLKGERSIRYFPNFSLPSASVDVALYNAIKLCHNGGVAIYMGKQSSIKTAFNRILELRNRNLDLSNIKLLANEEELEKLKNYISEYYGNEHYYTQTCELGILPHSSNIPNGVKLAVEYALKKGYISCVVCTSTLAQGVNIPIKYLLITSIRTGQEIIKARNFQNLIGRTARSGIFTEGSVIITDPRIYDGKNTRRGWYTWNDCIKLFDAKNSEPCSSSILSLVKDLEIDYESAVSGDKIVDYIIDHYDESDCFVNLANKISKLYLKKHPERKANNIFPSILLKQEIISHIENYLCLIISNLEDDSQIAVQPICQQTLAYSLASDDEKALLERIFERIGENLSNHSRDRLKNYSFAMSGINQSVRIENWIAEKDLTNVFHTEEELLDLILSFFKETTSIKKCHDEFDQICKMWIAGKTPLEISQETNCDVSDIDDLCNKIISYELNFFVGNISDLIVIQENDMDDEPDEDDAIDPRKTLSILQKKIKYGVPTQTAISICEKVFNDRILSQKITSVLGNDNVETDTIIRLIQFCDTLVLDVLEDYPEYFKDRVDYLIRDN